MIYCSQKPLHFLFEFYTIWKEVHRDDIGLNLCYQYVRPLWPFRHLGDYYATWATKVKVSLTCFCKKPLWLCCRHLGDEMKFCMLRCSRPLCPNDHHLGEADISAPFVQLCVTANTVGLELWSAHRPPPPPPQCDCVLETVVVTCVPVTGTPTNLSGY